MTDIKFGPFKDERAQAEFISIPGVGVLRRDGEGNWCDRNGIKHSVEISDDGVVYHGMMEGQNERHH